MEKATEDHWRELSEHILTDIKEWRRSHPKATFREIEDEVHTRMSRLEAQVLQDTAQESKSREWSRTSKQETKHCLTATESSITSTWTPENDTGGTGNNLTGFFIASAFG